MSYRYDRYDDPPRRPHSASWHGTMDRMLDWLRRRPGESWAFFAAGVVLAMLLG